MAKWPVSETHKDDLSCHLPPQGSKRHTSHYILRWTSSNSTKWRYSQVLGPTFLLTRFELRLLGSSAVFAFWLTQPVSSSVRIRLLAHPAVESPTVLKITPKSNIFQGRATSSSFSLAQGSLNRQATACHWTIVFRYHGTPD